MWTQWHFEPGIIAGLGALAIGYALAAGRFRRTLLQLGGPAPSWVPPGALSAERPGTLRRRQVACFYTAVFVAAVALLSPLHAVGENYLLSAHMVQHLLITLVVPPLLLLGTPGWMLRPLRRSSLFRRVAGTLLTPLPAFFLFNSVFILWHVPAFYELALTSAPAHALEHGLFLVLAMLSWWPVFGPLPEYPRLPYAAQLIYLFFESLPPTILGAVISLAEVPLYQTYWQAPRILPIGPLEDQQLGGLIMWIPGALAYFIVLTVIWFVWLERRSQTEEPPFRTINPDRARIAPR